jgi:hypothetical protein
MQSKSTTTMNKNRQRDKNTQRQTHRDRDRPIELRHSVTIMIFFDGIEIRITTDGQIPFFEGVGSNRLERGGGKKESKRRISTRSTETRERTDRQRGREREENRLLFHQA